MTEEDIKARILELKRELQEVYDRYPDLIGISWNDENYIVSKQREDGAVYSGRTKLCLDVRDLERLDFEDTGEWTVQK